MTGWQCVKDASHCWLREDLLWWSGGVVGGQPDSGAALQSGDRGDCTETAVRQRCMQLTLATKLLMP